LSAILFNTVAKIETQVITFRTTPEAIVALLRNDVQMMIDFPPAISGQVNSGKLRVLASSGTLREAAMPDVPTADEAGVKGYEVTSWNGVFAPKGTPKEVIEIMNDAMQDILRLPEVKQQFAKVGVEAHASSPDELMRQLTADIIKWNSVIDNAGISRK